MFKLAKARARRSRDLDTVKFIKDDDGRVLVKSKDIKARWRNYFHKLFNGTRERQEVTEDFGAAQGQRNYCFCRKITKEEVKRALRKMGRAKAVGPDQIPIEVWKCLGEEGARWLTDLFNVIFKTARMPEEWRSSVLVPLYKNKGDAQLCGNYRGIKLLSHTMKLWEMVMECRIRRETRVTENRLDLSLTGRQLKQYTSLED